MNVCMCICMYVIVSYNDVYLLFFSLVLLLGGIFVLNILNARYKFVMVFTAYIPGFLPRPLNSGGAWNTYFKSDLAISKAWKLLS